MHTALNPKGCAPKAMAAGRRFQWNQYSPPADWLAQLAATFARITKNDVETILKNLERHTTGTGQTADTIRAHLKIIYAILTQKVTPEEAGFQIDLTVEEASTALQIVEGLQNCSAGALERLVVVCDRWESPHSLNGLLGNLRSEIVEKVARSRFRVDGNPSFEFLSRDCQWHGVEYFRGNRRPALPRRRKTKNNGGHQHWHQSAVHATCNHATHRKRASRKNSHTASGDTR
jgi:hypothetical protein